MKAKVLAVVQTILVCTMLIGSFVLPLFYEHTVVSRLGFFVLEWIAFIVVCISSQILIGFLKGLYNSFLDKEEK